MSALRALSEFCEYGETLNEMLRDRLVCGIDDERTQRRLAEKELLFARALEIARATEAANKECAGDNGVQSC